MIVFGYFLPAGKNFASQVLTSERWIERLSPIFWRSCWRIWAIVIHSSRRPASAQKVNVVPDLTPAASKSCFARCRLNVYGLSFLLYALLFALISELPSDGVASPEKAAWFIATRLIA